MLFDVTDFTVQGRYFKIDIEGAELAALHGMRRTLDRFRPRAIICETPEHGPAVEWLRSFDYRVPNLLFEVAS
jgi:hypothetical protein